MAKVPRLLSKTKLMRGYRCLKSIHNTIHRPELEPKVTAAQQQVFDLGHQVGEKAREYYPGGVLVDCEAWEFVDALKRTRELLRAGTDFVYEAAFEYKGCYARADIMKFNKATQRWTLIEVKSSTKLKPEHLDDVGLQAWIIANSGLKLEKICIAHLNPECRFPNLSNLFIEEDVTDRLRESYTAIAPKLNSIFSCVRKEDSPDEGIGPQCTAYGRDCEFKSVCWKEAQIPDLSVFNLPKIRERAWELYRSGKVELVQLTDADLDPLQHRIVQAHRSNQRYLDREGLTQAMADWKFPLVFLDFETINPAIPCFDGCSPYEQVPFQFSVHIWRNPQDATVEHFEFLHEDKTDPRPHLIPALLDACGTQGQLVAYYAKFEKDCLEALAEFDLAKKNELLDLASRLVDPLPILRDFVYDPAFACRFSLKNVAPALLGERFSYAHMAIGDGSAAQRAFLELCQEPSLKRRTQLRQDMLAYCQQDTQALFETVKWLLNPPVETAKANGTRTDQSPN